MAQPAPVAPARAIVKAGELPQIKAIGRPFAPHQDVYHQVLTMTWPRFFAWVAGFWFLINFVYAALYFAVPGSLDGEHTDRFADCFFFSVQTLATIGYGTISPGNLTGNLLVVAESLTGILLVALITGMTFARFARPRALVLFTDHIAVVHRDGAPHLLIRVANARHNQIVDANLRVGLLLTTRTSDGQEMRVPAEVKLVRDKTSVFFLSWTVAHRIDASSPFYGKDALERLRAQDAQIFCTLVGLDETIAQTIHVRHMYTLDDIAWGARFADVLRNDTDGVRVLDYTKFHELVEAPLPEDDVPNGATMHGRARA